MDPYRTPSPEAPPPGPYAHPPPGRRATEPREHPGPAPAGYPAPDQAVATPPAEPRLREDSRVMDLLFTSVALLTVGFLSFITGVGYAGAAAGVSALASLVMPAALYWRRTRPVASAVVIYAAALLHFAAGATLLFADVLIFVALYSVTAHGPRWAGRAALTGGILGATLQGVVMAGTSGPGLDSHEPINWTMVGDNLAVVFYVVVLIGVVCLLAWALGLLRRSRLAHTETLAERARRLEIERDQQAQIATAAERSRIAREMHDVVAHSLSVVIAQADGGRYAAGTDPDAAVRALTTISDTGRAALADMRKILGVLRAPGQDQAAEPTTPQPIDADLDQLVEQVRGSGLDVSLVRVGQSRTLPPGLGLTVYRICQEALTNVLKHGGPAASATVLIQWQARRITVQVDDTGRGAAAADDGAGHGMVGMQERVNLFAGTLEAGPKPGGGFRVRADIPLPGGPVPPPAPVATSPPLAPASWPQQPPQNGAP